MGGMFGMMPNFGMMGMFGMGGGMFGMGGFGMGMGMMAMMPGGMLGMIAANDPFANQPDPKQANTIGYFAPAMALIIRAPSRMHTSITGGIIGGKSKRVEAAAWLEMERKGDLLARSSRKQPNIKVAPVQGGDPDAPQFAKKREDLDPNKIWNEAIAKGGATPGMVIATADFLFEAGHFKHAAEFLKANLRQGVVVRPWVFEALAIALEASGGDPEEIRRARLSGIALDPKDAQGFMSAARAMADRGQHDRALAFCRQAALLEPNDYHPYEVALAYAETAKDSKAMEWAVGKLVSQDWPVDNLFLHQNARKRLDSLATTLRSENRTDEADHLKTALDRLNQRDLIIRLIWDTSGTPAELEMKVKEPCGSICTLEQKQTPGGGIMIGYNLTDKDPSSQYVVAQAFSGEYEVSVSRIYGQPLGNRARLQVIQNAGTPQQTMRLEIIRLDQNAPIKITVKDGRRTELATVSPAASRHPEAVREEQASNTFQDLRALAQPNFYGAAGPRGGAGTPGARIPSVSSPRPARDSKSSIAPTPIAQNAFIPPGGAGVQMTTQLRESADHRSMDVVIRPFFDAINAASNRPPINLSVIPGGGAN